MRPLRGAGADRTDCERYEREREGESAPTFRPRAPCAAHIRHGLLVWPARRRRPPAARRGGRRACATRGARGGRQIRGQPRGGIALSSIRGPVAVVAVAGRARQGKSYLLNALLRSRRGAGFAVGATQRPCTKGVWMWSHPIQMQGYHLVSGEGGGGWAERRGRVRAPSNPLPSPSPPQVLLDTEGIDAYDQTGRYSTQIFELAVLLSR